MACYLRWGGGLNAQAIFNITNAAQKMHGTYTSDVTIRRDNIVVSTGDILMAAGMKIIIEPGGVFVLRHKVSVVGDASYNSNNLNTTWKGIEVQGTNAYPQDNVNPWLCNDIDPNIIENPRTFAGNGMGIALPGCKNQCFLGSFNQGFLYCDAATIRYADIGVFSGELNSANIWSSTKPGGIVRVNNSKLENNWVSICFAVRYVHENNSSITNNYFYWKITGTAPHNNKNQIYKTEINVYLNDFTYPVRGNYFSNTANQYNYKIYNVDCIGIMCGSSRLDIEENIVTGFEIGCEVQTGVPYRPTEGAIINNSFIDNYLGVRTNVADGTTICKNRIVTGYVTSTSSNLASFGNGIELNASLRSRVFSNNIVSANNNKSVKQFGIFEENDMGIRTAILKNTFDGGLANGIGICKSVTNTIFDCNIFTKRINRFYFCTIVFNGVNSLPTVISNLGGPLDGLKNSFQRKVTSVTNYQFANHTSVASKTYYYSNTGNYILNRSSNMTRTSAPASIRCEASLVDPYIRHLPCNTPNTWLGDLDGTLADYYSYRAVFNSLDSTEKRDSVLKYDDLLVESIHALRQSKLADTLNVNHYGDTLLKLLRGHNTIVGEYYWITYQLEKRRYDSLLNYISTVNANIPVHHLEYTNINRDSFVIYSILLDSTSNIKQFLETNIASIDSMAANRYSLYSTPMLATSQFYQTRFNGVNDSFYVLKDASYPEEYFEADSFDFVTAPVPFSTALGVTIFNNKLLANDTFELEILDASTLAQKYYSNNVIVNGQGISNINLTTSSWGAGYYVVILTNAEDQTKSKLILK